MYSSRLIVHVCIIARPTHETHALFDLQFSACGWDLLCSCRVFIEAKDAGQPAAMRSIMDCTFLAKVSELLAALLLKPTTPKP